MYHPKMRYEDVGTRWKVLLDPFLDLLVWGLGEDAVEGFTIAVVRQGRTVSPSPTSLGSDLSSSSVPRLPAFQHLISPCRTRTDWTSLLGDRCGPGSC